MSKKSMNIAFNFFTSNVGGVIGFKRAILENLASISSNLDEKFFVISDEETYKNLRDTELNFIVKKPKNNLEKFLFYEKKADKLLKSFQINSVVNFGDIPIVTEIDQVFYFDWPYAVYDDKEVWERMSLKDNIFNKLKLLYFKKNINKADRWIAQSELMKKRLISNFGLSNISVIDIGFNDEFVHHANNINGPNFDFDYLIYPTVYYPYKNIEIIAPVARLIKKKNLNLKIILTISESDHRLSKKFINQIKQEGLDEIVLIKGRLERSELINLMKYSKGLFMPTLIESYGLPYIEAQSLNIPIYTSDRDFSRELCKDSAFYFDPLNPEDIFRCVFNNINKAKVIEENLMKQKEILKEKISWKEVVLNIISVAKN